MKCVFRVSASSSTSDQRKVKRQVTKTHGKQNKPKGRAKTEKKVKERYHIEEKERKQQAKGEERHRKEGTKIESQGKRTKWETCQCPRKRRGSTEADGAQAEQNGATLLSLSSWVSFFSLLSYADYHSGISKIDGSSIWETLQ